MIYQCCDNARRAVLVAQTVYNGIDYLEVADGPNGPQTVLYVYFLHPLAPGQLTLGNLQITGGERITNILITSAVEGATLSPPPVYESCEPGSPPDGSNLLVVTVAQPGDFSPYTLSLVAGLTSTGEATPPPYFDPIFSSITFSFKAGCPALFDCQQTTACAPAAAMQPNFSYLAKDYTSFRSLMLDRLSTILPAWSERNPADLGIVLVELLAYVGDYLSYEQDAVATEAYLATARRRTSVRRHVKLVDYPMLDGRNARAWIHFDVSADFTLNTQTWSGRPQQILTQGSNPALTLSTPSDAYTQALSQNPQVFELMEPAALYAAHNRMQLYTWGDQECCLPTGATCAWLRGAFPNLVAGMVVIFEEVLGPQTGAAEDADPAHRWPVRLTAVEAAQDPIGNLFATPPSSAPLDVTRIAWSSADALPFAVCVSSLVEGAGQGSGASFFDGVSVVLGNNALADNGRTILDEALPFVPAVNPALVLPSGGGCERCSTAVSDTEPPIRYSPQLASGPLTFAEVYAASDSTGAPAPAVNATTARQLTGILPAITLTIPPSADVWSPVLDLLHSGAESKEFVAETEDDGTTTLRFGDGTFGREVIAGDIYHARYRVGVGTTGNVGADSLCRIASDDPVLASNVIVAITNPLAASGGLDPETLDSVRANAPWAFNTQERAVTLADYGTMAQQVDPTLEQARGSFRWTGSWRTVFLSVQPESSETVSATEKSSLLAGMESYRMMGHDLDVNAPVWVSLELAMDVCPASGYLPADVKQAIVETLSNATAADGTVGLFRPGSFTFGQPVYLSPIIAAVQQIDGVASVTVTTFQRQSQPATSGLSSGVIAMQPLEIARLDNDPNYPEHGKLAISVGGGR